MSRIRSLMIGLGAVALTGACASESPRALTGTAPAGTTGVLAVDADGRAFNAPVDAAGAFTLQIDSTRPVTAFLVTDAGLRVLRVAPSAGAPATRSSLPAWTGTVNTAQMSTCDCNADGADEDAEGADNILAQMDTDDDGSNDLDDADDDNDGIDDEGDDDSDGSGEDDSGEDLDSDDDARPDGCDDDDDNDGVRDEDDEDEAGDSDDDGVSDDEDEDDDNDGDDDGEDSDDDDDGVDDEDEVEDDTTDDSADVSG